MVKGIIDEDIFDAWNICDVDDLWCFDKLILSRKLGYICGPVGIDVPSPNRYIVRPITNITGLGLGASFEYIECDTSHLNLGYFWCEIFTGPHISVDYFNGEQTLAVQGFKPDDELRRWDRWIKVDNNIPLPDILLPLSKKYTVMNAEYIGGKLIEVHLRYNPDWSPGQQEFIPVWEGQLTTPPHGFKYVEYPDVHGRIGAFVR